MAFNTEAEMHEWLRSYLLEMEGLSAVIVNMDICDKVNGEPTHIRKVRDTFKYCSGFLYHTELLIDNQNISISERDILKPDFVLYSPDSEGIVIVELKNLVSASRQAGTEASAYAGELRSHLPFTYLLVWGFRCQRCFCAFFDVRSSQLMRV